MRSSRIVLVYYQTGYEKLISFRNFGLSVIMIYLLRRIVLHIFRIVLMLILKIKKKQMIVFDVKVATCQNV